jgi:nucleosome assembly protein 1-like 1
MSKQNIIEKCEGTAILWLEGRDPTKKKTKKKNKKTKKTETKTVDADSFFTFFRTVSIEDTKDLTAAATTAAVSEAKEEEEEAIGDKMDNDFELGNEFKDQLIPLALEYYLEVIEHDEEEGDDYGDEDKQDKDSDEDD